MLPNRTRFQNLNQMTDVESQLKEAERIYNLDKSLYQQKVIGLQEFKKAENDYNYYAQKRNLTEQLLKQDSVSNATTIGSGKTILPGFTRCFISSSGKK